MAQGKSQFVGLCGAYYVAYCVTSRGLHASLTVGNAPNIDVLVSAVDGARLLALQVKTSSNAHYPNKYGHVLWEWQVGPSVPELCNDALWYAFVDLRENNGVYKPEVFLVPSHWVAAFCNNSAFDTPWKHWGRKVYWLLREIEKDTRERWDLVERFIAGDQEVQESIRTAPQDCLWRAP
jgi:hypothetical protein